MVLTLKNIRKSFGEKEVLKGFTFSAESGEALGILGRNGAGKTTLLKLLTGKLEPSSGSVELGTNVEMAFLDQLRSEIKDELTVAENIASDRDEVIIGGVKKHVFSYLSDFLFSSERARTPVKALSGGEKARLLLAKLFLKPANLLIMDEPTNDLDIETLELLEDQLLAYKGTLLLVSHDREFLDNVITSTYALDGKGNIEEYPGGWEDFERQSKSKRESPSAPESEKESAKPQSPQLESQSKAKKKLSYNEQRELDALPDKIDTLEKELESIRSELSNPDIYRLNPARAKELTDRMPLAEQELDAALERWTTLAERCD